MQYSILYRSFIALCFTLALISCKQEKKSAVVASKQTSTTTVTHAKGFTVATSENGVTTIEVNSPWPNAETNFKYALVPKTKMAHITLNKDEYDAIIAVPINNIVVTSTTHIPVLEALGVENKLVGFPDTKYVSSEKTRKRIDTGKVIDLGKNNALNSELAIELQPDLIIGFSINSQNKAYSILERANIPVVYNGDWTEETPLGKAEWIKFFAPFFGKEILADQVFKEIEQSYLETKALAQTAAKSPTVMSGAMYKDVWYLAGGKSWAARFLADANANYLWKDANETGSLSLSWETVLERGKNAEFWIGTSQFGSYNDMNAASNHYAQFDSFQTKNLFTFSNSKGATGGLLYYEIAPQRPDLVLKDLIYILHPELLPDHELMFFKPLL